MPSAVAKGVALLVLFGGVSPAAGQNNVFANKAALQTAVLTLALLGLLSYKVFCRKGGLRGRRRDLTSHASIELTPQGALAYI